MKITGQARTRLSFVTVLSGPQASLSVPPMTDSSPKQVQLEDAGNGQTTYAGSVIHRKLSVKGSGGVSATVVVTVQQGKVWLSIVPPFTWDAIMEPVKVDELIRTLGLAREDAKRMARGKCVSHRDKQQPAGNVIVLPGNKALHAEQASP